MQTVSDTCVTVAALHLSVHTRNSSRHEAAAGSLATKGWNLLGVILSVSISVCDLLYPVCRLAVKTQYSIAEV